MNLKEWSQRNINYYKRNFDLLSKGEAACFNWAAFLGGPAYWAYRKMYGVAIGLIIFRHLCSAFQWCVHKLGIQQGVFEIIFSFLVLGFYIWLANNANAYYYKFVKEQVRRGYDKVEKFQPTSAFLFWLVFLDSGMSTILSLVGIVAYAFADKYANTFKREEDLEVTSDETDQYLEGTEEEHDYGKKANILIGGLILVSIAEIGYAVRYVYRLEQERITAESNIINENLTKSVNKVVKEIDKKPDLR